MTSPSGNQGKYTCRNELHLRFLKHPTVEPLWPHTGPPMSSESALLRLKAFNESDLESSERVDAFLNLNKLYDIDKEEDWYDIAPKVFLDLDVALFEGKLNGNVYFCWRNPEEMKYKDWFTKLYPPESSDKSNFTFIPGAWVHRGEPGKRLHLALNSKKLLDDGAECAIDNLVFAMAYGMLEMYRLLMCPETAMTPYESETFQNAYVNAITSVANALRKETGFRPPDDPEGCSHNLEKLEAWTNFYWPYVKAHQRRG